MMKQSLLLNSLLDEEVETPQHAYVKHFGYKNEWVKHFVDTNSKDKKGEIKSLTQNRKLKCLICGNIHSHGIVGDAILNHARGVFPSTFNSMYSLAKPINRDSETFICGACLFSLKNYRNIKMHDHVVTRDNKYQIDITSTESNEMYEWIMNPKEQFIMAINDSGGTNIQFAPMAYTPTVSKNVIAIAFGSEVYYVKRKLVKECMDEYIDIVEQLSTKKYKVGKAILFNELKNEELQKIFSKKLLEDKESYQMIMQFYMKYDRGTRRVASKLLLKHITKKGE